MAIERENLSYQSVTARKKFLAPQVSVSAVGYAARGSSWWTGGKVMPQARSPVPPLSPPLGIAGQTSRTLRVDPGTGNQDRPASSRLVAGRRHHAVV